MMKRKMKFITKITMVLLMVIGCLSYRSVFADDDKLKISIDSSVTEAIEGDLVVDLYKVAYIEWDSRPDKATYVLKTEDTSPFKTDFNGLDVGVKENSGISDDKIKELANKAAAIVFGSDPKITPFGNPLPVNQENTVASGGLYLAIVRSTKMNKKDITAANVDEYLVGEDGKYHSFAYSHDKEYDFDPLLVFIRGDHTNPVNLDEKEDDELVMLKYSEKDRFGLMEIVKFVTLGGQPATVAFRVKGYESEAAYNAGDEPIYERVLSIGIKDAGEYHDDTLLLDDIPVNTYVVVEEEYAGASYTLYKTVTPESSVITPIEMDENRKPIPQTWEFYNKLSDKNKKGYGIRNTVDKDGITQTELNGGTANATTQD